MKRSWYLKLDCGHEQGLTGALSKSPVERKLYCGVCRENRVCIQYGWREVRDAGLGS